MSRPVTKIQGETGDGPTGPWRPLLWLFVGCAGPMGHLEPNLRHGPDKACHVRGPGAGLPFRGAPFPCVGVTYESARGETVEDEGDLLGPPTDEGQSLTPDCPYEKSCTDELAKQSPLKVFDFLVVCIAKAS